MNDSMGRAARAAHGWRDGLCLALFVVWWLVPMTYVGLTRKSLPGMPRLLRHLQDTAYLFPRAVKSWRLYYIQIQRHAGGAWETVPAEARLFRMPSFGYRTRMSRFFEIFRTRSGARGRRELAAWIRRQYAQEASGAGAAIAVRFIEARYRVRRDGPAGAWSTPPLESFRPQDLTVISTDPATTP